MTTFEQSPFAPPNYSIIDQSVQGETRTTAVILDGEVMMFDTLVSTYEAGREIETSHARDRSPLDVTVTGRFEEGGRTLVECLFDGEPTVFDLGILRDIAKSNQPPKEETDS